ncbi:MAG: plasmid pRiA4b ORF-3 family protein [Alicyclobacillus macrosporangiidus]|uniref:plasmid pRiA4b ORF-3 family protein n=1 Tax=Alicyclobacillus macrosporangiidus TaxID=392015 RepID=UPI0026F32C18|nr:plasmid pRiA4b ORF-3 family protein [Alicyclobacillus macrosporangiidus]MCL6600962.1 plasmid pRiA4b ORF-3 family protein [Alicyclobacillus macrosporangiidus]
MPAKDKPRPIGYEFEITLCGVHPTVWRRFRVPANITFQRLHEVIQIVMGWTDYHLYEFRYGNVRIGIPDDETFILDATHFDARWKRLPSFSFDRNDVLGYLYDFGDDWMHTLHLVMPIYHLPDERAYFCVDGENACPPEDVGGWMGYEHFLHVIGDPNHPEHEAMQVWSGGHFDPFRFDKDAVNRVLRERFEQR